jgi:hypothetical protein
MSDLTSNLGLTKPSLAEPWRVPYNANFDLIDVSHASLSSRINDVAGDIADSPEVYFLTGTFNGSTGRAISLPKSVSAVTEYGTGSPVPNTHGGAIGDTWVIKGLSSATVYCAEANTTDTFILPVYYKGELNAYGNSQFREWIASPDSAITDHGNVATVGSLAWVLNEASGTSVDVRIPGNHTYPTTQAITIPANVRVKPDNGAVIQAATGGSSSFTVLTISAGVKISGTLTVDGNRAGRTGTIAGISLADDNIELDTIRAINCSGTGITSPDPVAVGPIYGLRARLLYVSNCGRGMYLSTPQCHIEQIICDELNAITAGVYQHGVDLVSVEDGYIGDIAILDSDGSTVGASAWLTALTIFDFNRSVINRVTIRNMDSATLAPLAISLISADKSIIRNIWIEGYEGGRHLELLSVHDCLFDGGTIWADHGVVRGNGAASSSTGIVTSNYGIQAFSGARDGHHYTRSAGNTIRNINIYNMYTGVKDGGRNNIFENVVPYGCTVDGWSFTRINDDSSAFPGSSNVYDVENAELRNCGAIGNGRSGIYSVYGSNIKVLGGAYRNNGQDSVLSATLRCGIRADDYTDTALGHATGWRVKDVDARDTQSFTRVAGASFDAIALSAATFEITLPTGSERYFVGQRLYLEDSSPAAADMMVRICKLNGTDTATVYPLTVTTGTLTTPLTAGTGTISTVGTAVTGGGSPVFQSEIPGRYWIKANGEYRQVESVTSNTVMTLVTAFSTDLVGETFEIVKADVTGIPSQYRALNKASGVTDFIAKDVRFTGVTDTTTPTGGISCGQMESGVTASIVTATPTTVTFTREFATAPHVMVTAQTADQTVNAVAYTRTRTNFIVEHNGATDQVVQWAAVEATP